MKPGLYSSADETRGSGQNLCAESAAQSTVIVYQGFPTDYACWHGTARPNRYENSRCQVNIATHQIAFYSDDGVCRVVTPWGKCDVRGEAGSAPKGQHSSQIQNSFEAERDQPR